MRTNQLCNPAPLSSFALIVGIRRNAVRSQIDPKPPAKAGGFFWSKQNTEILL